MPVDEVDRIVESIEGGRVATRALARLLRWADHHEVRATLAEFQERHSHLFSRGDGKDDDDDDDDEHSHAAHAAFSRFETLFANTFEEEFLRENNVGGGDDAARAFVDALRSAADRDADDDAALRSVLAILDFRCFAEAMRRRERESELAADDATYLGL